MANDDEKCGCGDEMMLGPDLGDGHLPYVRHTADHSIEAGIARVVREGQPIQGEVVSIERQEGRPTYRVRPFEDVRAPGPPKVVSDAYRAGWDNLFGKKAPVAQA